MVKQETSFGAATDVEEELPREGERTSGSWLLSLTSLGFIVLQSVCTALMALSGLRLIIGVGALAAASSLKSFAGAFHVDAIRIPMMILAVGGSLLNLFIIWRLRTLRGRSASQWRMAAVPASKKRAENLQIALALATLVLVALEQAFHLYLNEA